MEAGSSWRELENCLVGPGSKPRNRYGHSAHWNAEQQLIFVYGGRDHKTSRVYGEVFSLSYVGSTCVWNAVNYSAPLRYHHAAVLLENNLLVFGGMDDSHAPTNSLLALDTATWKAIECTTRGDAPSARYQHSMRRVPGKPWVIVFGGRDASAAPLNDVHLLNMESLKWAKLETQGKGPSPRFGASIWFKGNKMYVFGGHSGGDFLNDCFSLHLDDLKWSAVNPKSSDAPAADQLYSCSDTEKTVVLVGQLRVNAVYTCSKNKPFVRWYRHAVNDTLPVMRSPTAVWADASMYLMGGSSGSKRHHELGLWALDLSAMLKSSSALKPLSMGDGQRYKTLASLFTPREKGDAPEKPQASDTRKLALMNASREEQHQEGEAEEEAQTEQERQEEEDKVELATLRTAMQKAMNSQVELKHQLRMEREKVKQLLQQIESFSSSDGEQRKALKEALDNETLRNQTLSERASFLMTAVEQHTMEIKVLTEQNGRLKTTIQDQAQRLAHAKQQLEEQKEKNKKSSVASLKLENVRQEMSELRERLEAETAARMVAELRAQKREATAHELYQLMSNIKVDFREVIQLALPKLEAGVVKDTVTQRSQQLQDYLASAQERFLQDMEIQKPKPLNLLTLRTDAHTPTFSSGESSDDWSGDLHTTTTDEEEESTVSFTSSPVASPHLSARSNEDSAGRSPLSSARLVLSSPPGSPSRGSRRRNSPLSSPLHSPGARRLTSSGRTRSTSPVLGGGSSSNDVGPLARSALSSSAERALSLTDRKKARKLLERHQLLTSELEYRNTLKQPAGAHDAVDDMERSLVSQTARYTNRIQSLATEGAIGFGALGENGSEAADAHPLLRELIGHERQFVEFLDVLLTRFEEPMRSNGILSPAHCGALFSNLYEMKEAHEDVQQRLQAATEATQFFRIYKLRMGTLLDILDEYMVSLPQALCTYETQLQQNRKLGRFLSRCAQDKKVRFVDLRSALTRPLSHLLQYRQIFDAIHSTLQKAEEAQQQQQQEEGGEVSRMSARLVVEAFSPRSVASARESLVIMSAMTRAVALDASEDDDALKLDDDDPLQEDEEEHRSRLREVVALSGELGRLVAEPAESVMSKLSHAVSSSKMARLQAQMVHKGAEDVELEVEGRRFVSSAEFVVLVQCTDKAESEWVEELGNTNRWALVLLSDVLLMTAPHPLRSRSRFLTCVIPLSLLVYQRPASSVLPPSASVDARHAIVLENKAHPSVSYVVCCSSAEQKVMWLQLLSSTHSTAMSYYAEQDAALRASLLDGRRERLPSFSGASRDVVFRTRRGRHEFRNSAEIKYSKADAGRVSVRCGTLGSLLRWLVFDISGPNAGEEIVHFLAAVPRVAAGDEVFRRVRTMFYEHDDSPQNEDETARCEAEGARIRILEFFFIWLSHFGMRDVLGEAEAWHSTKKQGGGKGAGRSLFMSIVRFVEQLPKTYGDVANPLKLSLLRMDAERRAQRLKRRTVTNPSTLVALPEREEAVEFYDVKAKALAEQLTLVVHSKFCEISEEDLLVGSSTASVASMVEYWNQLNQWAAGFLEQALFHGGTRYDRHVLDAPESGAASEVSKEYSFRVKKLLAVAYTCLNLGNFDSSFALGLVLDQCYMPQHMWDSMSKKYRDVRAKLQHLVSVARGFHNYRQLIDAHRPPGIPYLAILLKDTLLSQENDDEVEGLINYQKVVILGKHLYQLQRFKQPYSSIAKDASLMRRLQMLSVFNDMRDRLASNAVLGSPKSLRRKSMTRLTSATRETSPTRGLLKRGSKESSPSASEKQRRVRGMSMDGVPLKRPPSSRRSILGSKESSSSGSPRLPVFDGEGAKSEEEESDAGGKHTSPRRSKSENLQRKKTVKVSLSSPREKRLPSMLPPAPSNSEKQEESEGK